MIAAPIVVAVAFFASVVVIPINNARRNPPTAEQVESAAIVWELP